MIKRLSELIVRLIDKFNAKGWILYYSLKYKEHVKEKRLRAERDSVQPSSHPTDFTELSK